MLSFSEYVECTEYVFPPENTEAAPMNIISINNEWKCIVKGVAGSDEPTENAAVSFNPRCCSLF